MGDYSPEKAGVGGSIPSLATMFPITYKPSIPNLASICVQNSVDHFAQAVYSFPLRFGDILDINIHGC